jgi:hypothetical protein
MLLNLLIITLGLFFLVVFESFFITLGAFSVLIVVLLLLIDKWDWKKWMIFAFLSTLLVDIVLLRALGTSLLIVSVSSLVLYLIFLVMPKKQIILSYIPYFFAILIFYILIDLVSPFIQERVWGVISWSTVLGCIIKSIVSTAIIFAANMIIDNFRSNEQLKL